VPEAGVAAGLHRRLAGSAGHVRWAVGGVCAGLTKLWRRETDRIEMLVVDGEVIAIARTRAGPPLARILVVGLQVEVGRSCRPGESRYPSAGPVELVAHFDPRDFREALDRLRTRLAAPCTVFAVRPRHPCATDIGGSVARPGKRRRDWRGRIARRERQRENHVRRALAAAADDEWRHTHHEKSAQTPAPGSQGQGTNSST